MTPTSHDPSGDRPGRTVLRTNLGAGPLARALEAAGTRSADVELRLTGPELAYQAFGEVIHGQDAYDASELALGLFLELKTFGKPFVLLPVTVSGKHQHHCLVYNHAVTGPLTPRGLEGRRVGLRNYAQTTAIWIRGVLQHDYGVDLEAIDWRAERGSHVVESRDPPHVSYLTGDRPLADRLLSGEIDAAILRSDEIVGGDIRHVIAEPREAAQAWSARHGVVPVNHLFSVRSDAGYGPHVYQQVFDILGQAKRRLPVDPALPDFLPLGIDRLRGAVELLTRFAVEQQIIPRGFSVDDIFRLPGNTTLHANT